MRENKEHYRIGETEIISIPVVMRKEGAVRAHSGRFGIVAPVYYGGLPTVVMQFLERLDLSRIGIYVCRYKLWGVAAPFSSQGKSYPKKEGLNAQPLQGT